MDSEDYRDPLEQLVGYFTPCRDGNTLFYDSDTFGRVVFIFSDVSKLKELTKKIKMKYNSILKIEKPKLFVDMHHDILKAKIAIDAKFVQSDKPGSYTLDCSLIDITDMPIN